MRPDVPRTEHTVGMTWAEYFQQHDRAVLEATQLAADGVSRRHVSKACRDGILLRVRRGHFVVLGTAPRIVEAVRVGGRLTCSSATADYGVFSFEQGVVHAHLESSASFPKHSRPGSHLIGEHKRSATQVHWGRLMEPAEGNEYRVGLADAIRQVFLCQGHRLGMAALENSLHIYVLQEGAVRQIFRALPGRFQYLQALIDGRSESGQETVLRLILIEAGFDVEIQVSIGGVGRVDMVVDGMLVVEADSRQFHDGWEAHARDRTRDVSLAGFGYMSLRVLYRDIMFDPQRVVLAVRGLLKKALGQRPWDVGI